MSLASRTVGKFSLVWIASFAYLYAVYSPAASIPYAHHDQYRYFVEDDHSPDAFKADRTNDPQWSWLRALGRPVAAELEHQVFKRVRVMQDLVPLRAFGVGLAATAMAILVFHLLYLKASPILAFCVAGAIYTLPAVQFSVFMTSFNHPVAQILALLGAFFIRLGSRPLAHGWAMSKCIQAMAKCLQWAACYGVAVCLLVVAQMSYAPSAFVALLPMGAEIVFKGPAGWASSRRHLLRDTVVVAASCLIYFAIIKTYYFQPGAVSVAAYQMKINHDLLNRFGLLVFDVGKSVLNFWNVLYPTEAFALGAVGFLISGACLVLVRQLAGSRCRTGRTVCSARFSNWLQMVCGLAFLMVFSEATYLAAPVPMSLYRMHFASTAMAVLLMVGAAISWGRLLNKPWRRTVSCALVSTLLCGCGLFAHWSVLMNCLNSQMEFSFVASQIAAHASDRICRIHVVKPGSTARSYNGLPVVRGDEFNVASTNYDLDIPWLVRAALCNVFDCASFTVKPVPHTRDGIAASGDPAVIAVTASAADEPVIPSLGAVIIDMNDLLMLANSPKPPLTYRVKPYQAISANPAQAPEMQLSAR